MKFMLSRYNIVSKVFLSGKRLLRKPQSVMQHQCP
jgi:hypothetical protein